MSKLQLKDQNLFILAVVFCLPFYFIKFKYSWASLNLVEILILVVLFVWIFNRNKEYFILHAGYFMPTSLIFLGLLLSIIANKNYYTGLGIIKGWFVLPIIFAVVLFDNLKKNRKILDWLMAANFFSGVLVAIEGMYYWIAGLATYDGRLRIFYDSSNQLAMFLASALLVGLFIARRAMRATQQKNGWKIFPMAVGLMLILFNLYLTKSYGAWLAIVAALVAILWLKYSKKIEVKYLIIAVTALVILAATAGFSKFDNIKNLGDRSSLASRAIIWKSAALMVEKNPLFGIGPGNFQNTYLEYQKYFPPYLEWAVPQPHNTFLAFWLEAGFLGLAGFVWILVLFFRDNKKAIENNRLYGTICFAIILYYLIHGLVDTTYWRNDMAVLFWTAVAVNYYLAVFSNQARTI